MIIKKISKSLTKHILIILMFYININDINAQINMNTTGNYASPSYLIDNILIGNGITTSNHSYLGDPSQIGFFYDTLGLIGMDSGFVLSTGSVDSIGNIGSDTLGWNYIWDSTFTNIIDSTPWIENYHLSTGFMGAGDVDLLTIANSVPVLIGQTFSVSQTQDVAILEFDFVPSSDTLNFNYVFASEEYLSFVNSSYNDVFAFLISGPGITGPYASPPGFPGGAMNIAVVPNSTPPLPITISTVNDTINSQYYNHDTLSSVSAFNGYTDVFTATAVVIPCNVYHIKLAIADGSDDIYDSGVFFEAGSFDATEPGALNVTVITNDVSCYGDTTGSATICISGGVAPYTINWNGVNPNNLSAGTYSVDVTDSQGSSGTSNYIISSPSVLSISINQFVLDLESSIIGGTPPYTYNWTLNNIFVSNNAIYTPLQNGNYYLTVTDSNGCTTTSNFNVTNITSNMPEILSEKLLIYPNPTSKKLTVQLLNQNEKLLSISLFDPNGKIMSNISYSIKEGEIEINTDNLAKGIYLLLLKTENYVSKNKIIIK